MDSLRNELNKLHERAGMQALSSSLLVRFIEKDSYSPAEIRTAIFDAMYEIQNKQDGMTDEQLADRTGAGDPA